MAARMEYNQPIAMTIMATFKVIRFSRLIALRIAYLNKKIRFLLNSREPTERKCVASGGTHPRGSAPAEQGVTTVRFGTELRYGTVRFWQKVRYGITYGIFRKSAVRYGNTVLYFPYRAVHFPYSSNARFALLLPSTALFLFANNFTTSVALTAHQLFQITITFCEKAKLFCHNYNSIVQ